MEEVNAGADARSRTDASESASGDLIDARISIDEFARVELRVGQILKAERIEKSKKLLKLSVDLAELKGPRQVVAGIGKAYAPEDLIGRKVVIVANLQPANLMGERSEGMVLAASSEVSGLEILSPAPTVPVGTRIG